jgi:hypothetical protein
VKRILTLTAQISNYSIIATNARRSAIRYPDGTKAAEALGELEDDQVNKVQIIRSKSCYRLISGVGFISHVAFSGGLLHTIFEWVEDVNFMRSSGDDLESYG